jgi:predicted dehydrogenase
MSAQSALGSRLHQRQHHAEGIAERWRALANGIRSAVPFRPAHRAGVSAAIVGAGLMGRWHAHAIRQAGGRVVGVVDTDPRAANALAARIATTAFTDIDGLLSAVQPDVLHICTPLVTHEALTDRAIQAGLHALVEKPLTDDVATTERLCRLAERQGVLLVPVHQYLFQDGVLRTHRSLSSLGRLVHIQAVFCSAGAGDGAVTEASGDRVAAEILPHPLSLFELILPGSMPLARWRVTRPAAGELRLQTCAGDTTLSVLISMSGRPTRADLWVLGTLGSAYLDLFHGFALREPGRVSRLRKAARPFDVAGRLGFAAAANLGRRSLTREYAYPGLDELVRRLYRAISVGGPAPISAASVAAVARSRERALAAMRPVTPDIGSSLGR